MVYGMLYLVYGSISMNIVYQIGFWHTVYYIVYSIYHTFKYYQTLRGIWNAIWYVVHVYTVYIYIYTYTCFFDLRVLFYAGRISRYLGDAGLALH